jgi:hypothetical protein
VLGDVRDLHLLRRSSLKLREVAVLVERDDDRIASLALPSRARTLGRGEAAAIGRSTRFGYLGMVHAIVPDEARSLAQAARPPIRDRTDVPRRQDVCRGPFAMRLFGPYDLSCVGGEPPR